MKKKILLTAGGTATTWHFCNVIKEYFDEKFEIHVCDINDDYLIPASIYAYKFHKVPLITDKNYEKVMYKILEEEKIDFIIPLIDFDLKIFNKENKTLNELGVISTAPSLKTIEKLTNKKNMHDFLNKNGIPTPILYSIDDIDDRAEYVVKPIEGFGSNGVKILCGEEIKKLDLENSIIQEKCNPTEITAEIFNGNFVKIFQRERVATKAGVCVKMVPVNYDQINNSIKKLVKCINCPTAFCIQFMQNKNGDWCITDCNLRIGAGTALSTKIGFQLVRALLTSLLKEKVENNIFEIDSNIKSVLRVYQEIAIK